MSTLQLWMARQLEGFLPRWRQTHRGRCDLACSRAIIQRNYRYHRRIWGDRLSWKRLDCLDAGRWGPAKQHPSESSCKRFHGQPTWSSEGLACPQTFSLILLFDCAWKYFRPLLEFLPIQWARLRSWWGNYCARCKSILCYSASQPIGRRSQVELLWIWWVSG